MAAKPRTFQSWLAAALMGVLVLVFLLLGVGGTRGRLTDIFAGARGDAVVTAGQHVVTAREFKRIFDQQKQRIDQQQGSAVPLEMLIKNGLDRQMVDQMGEDRAFLELLRRSGITPGDAMVDAEIKKLPFAFDRVTGKFSPKAYTDFLANQGMTPRDAQNELRDDLAGRHFGAAASAGFRAPRVIAALNVVAGLAERDISYFSLGRDAVPMPAKPTDAQLHAFITEQKDRLTAPETRVITLVRFSAKALEPSVTVDPAALQKEFDFKKDSLSKPETRTLIQIPVKSAAQATEAAARLAKGEDPGVVARAYGVEPITYDDKPLTAIPDRKLAAAAFALRDGEAGGPIQGDLGVSAVHVLKVTPGVIATLESARPQLEADLRRKAAEDKVFDLSQKFDDARQGGASVAAAAAKAGVVAMTLPQVTAQGVMEDGHPNPMLTEKILKDAFAQTAGAETDLTDAGPGEYYALKVEKVIAPHLPDLEAHRVELTQFYMQMTFLKALEAKVDGLVERVRKGESIEAVAASAGGHVTHQVGLSQQSARQFVPLLGQGLLQATFAAKPGEAFRAQGPQGIYVAKLDAVRAPDTTLMARYVEQIGPQASQGYATDMQDALRSASAKVVKVTTNIDLARRALNVDPAWLPAGEKPGDKGAKPPAGKAPAGKPGERAK